jgi:hypothetical protein
MLRDEWISDAAVLAQSLDRAYFVRTHQPGVAGYIRSEDRGKTASGRGHGSGWPPGSRIGSLNFTTTRASRYGPASHPGPENPLEPRKREAVPGSLSRA